MDEMLLNIVIRVLGISARYQNFRHGSTEDCLLFTAGSYLVALRLC